MSEYEYRMAQVVSVKGGTAQVYLGGDSVSTAVGVSEYAELAEGDYSNKGCDWDDDIEEEELSDNPVPGDATHVTLKRRKTKNGNGKWSVHKVNNKPMHVLHYNIPDPVNTKPQALHNHERMIIRFAYASCDGPGQDWSGEGSGPFTFQVKVNGQARISNQIPNGQDVSTKKKAKKMQWVSPKDKITVTCTPGSLVSGAMVVIGYTTG